MKKHLTALAAVLVLTLASAAARADYVLHGTIKGKDGKTYDAYAVYTDKDVWKGTYYYDKDGKYAGYKGPGSNPSDDNGKGATDKPDLEKLKSAAKNGKGGGGESKPELWKTPIGKHITNAGKGLGPTYQPGDGDDGPGHLSAKGTIGKSPEEIQKQMMEEEAARAKAAMSHKEVDPNGGSIADQIKGHAKGGGGGAPPKPKGDGGPLGDKKGSSGPDENDKSKVSGKFYGDLPAPPEIVNPPWDGGKTAKAKTRTAQSTVKCAANMRPNASGKGCVPSLDMPGFDSNGSTARATPSLPAATARHGR